MIYRGSNKAARKYIYVKDAAIACLKVISKKYNNQCLTITGNKTYKIINILKKIKKKFNINKKITFLNEKNTSHYNIQPIPYIKIRSKNLIIKNQTPLIEKIIYLTNQKL